MDPNPALPELPAGTIRSTQSFTLTEKLRSTNYATGPVIAGNPKAVRRRSELTLFFLPPRKPELSPDENVLLI